MKIEFKNKIFLMTGRLDNFTRSQAEQLITERGGTIAVSYTSKIDYLLLGSSPGSKYTKVINHNLDIRRQKEIYIIREEQFAGAVLISSLGFQPRKQIAVPKMPKEENEQEYNTAKRQLDFE